MAVVSDQFFALPAAIGILFDIDRLSIVLAKDPDNAVASGLVLHRPDLDLASSVRQDSNNAILIVRVLKNTLL
jgi:hypothetical protein